MSRSITDDIAVAVKTTFEQKYSKAASKEFYFSYKISIENNSLDDVQLLSRHWFIFDSNGQYSQVKGEGVVGQQPIILQNQSYEYESFCKLETDIGLMWGTYLIKKQASGKLFEAKIPEFQLIVPSRLN